MNLFIVNHRRRHKFVSTAKAGSTSIKYATVEDDDIAVEGMTKNQDIHEVFGYVPDGKHMVTIQSPLYTDYLKVAVYRDPVSRFLSWYKDKVLGDNNDHTHIAGLSNEKNIDRALEFLDFELGKSNLNG